MGAIHRRARHVLPAWDWCPHDRPATMRLDTGLGQFGQSPWCTTRRRRRTCGARTPSSNTFDADPWWISVGVPRGKQPRAERSSSSASSPGTARNTARTRSAAFVRAARKNPALRGTARPGRVQSQPRLERDGEDAAQVDETEEVYARYRWVMAFESAAEPGYVTEKLAETLASGAVPIYYGDSRAARKVFGRRPTWTCSRRGGVGDRPRESAEPRGIGTPSRARGGHRSRPGEVRGVRGASRTC